MDFELTEEQRLFKDSAERLLVDHYAFEQRKSYGSEPDGWSRAMWARYAELGVLGVVFDESHGGIGGGPVETMIAMEAFGRVLALEPYLATVVLGAGLIRAAGSAEQKDALLPEVASGALTIAIAHGERAARYDLAHVDTRACRDGAGFKLDGEKSLVLHGDTADKFIVSARLSGDTRARDGIGLFMVDAHASGVTRRGYPTQDGQRAAEVTLNAVQVPPEQVLGDPERAFPAIQRVVDGAIAALCAEAVGVMGEMHRLTVEYLKTRKQFGTTIGSFQALQHRAVGMFVALEQARSMALFATMMADEEDAAERGKAMSAAKVQIGRSGRFIGQQAIQLHGGIGMTMELAVGHYFKRATMIDVMFGDADYHLARLADAGGLLAPAGQGD